MRFTKAYASFLRFPLACSACFLYKILNWKLLIVSLLHSHFLELGLFAHPQLPGSLGLLLGALVLFNHFLSKLQFQALQHFPVHAGYFLLELKFVLAVVEGLKASEELSDLGEVQVAQLL